MESLKIEQVYLKEMPNVPFDVTIKHRISSMPDKASSYVIDSKKTTVFPNGIFLPPFFIHGLLGGIPYTVKIIMNKNKKNFAIEEYTILENEGVGVVSNVTEYLIN